jgi:O-succinylbenzoic acid--CoA ligase
VPRPTIAALLEDDGPAVLLVHACRRLGARHVPLNRRAARAELAAQLRMVGDALLVYDEANAVVAADISVGTGLPLALVEALLTHAGAEHAIPAGAPADVSFAGWADDLDAPATVLFTSGTTGRPRGAVLSQADHLASAAAWAAVLSPRPTDRWLGCLPLFHVAGLAVVIRAALWGSDLEVLRRFDVAAVAEGIATGVSHLSLVPTQLEELLRAWGDRPAPSTLRAILLGGATIPGPLLARARGLGLPVLTTYGMTETASGVAVGGADPQTRADPSALRPLPGVRLRVVDADADGVGQVEVAGDMVFAGYLGEPDTESRTVDGDWLRTGDLGRLGTDGLLRIVDRRDDLIISGGENVYPAEVEAVLLAHPDVVEVAVVGQPDRRWGSVPVAAIVLSEGSRAGDEDLTRHCRERLAGYKVPVRFHRVSVLPRGEGGKVLRRELREHVAEGDA